MKKIIALLLTLVLCVASFGTFIIATGATSPAPELEIAACNLSFRNSVCIKYAVEANVSDVKLLIWTSPESEYTVGTQDAELTEYYSELIDGNSYIIFDYTALTAKQMTDVVYARAYYEAEGEGYYSEVKKYSILQYAYNKLGKTATASTDTELKEMLTHMLEYGAAAQKYLDDYKIDRLATADWYQVKLTAGKLDDGCTHGLYLPGNKVTMTAPAVDGSDIPFSHWENSNGDKVATTATYELTVGNENEVYTPVYASEDSGAQGTPAKITRYNAVGSLKYIDEYDANGKLIKATYYNADGSINGHSEFAYDVNGKLIKETFYNADGSINGHSEAQYDENGKWIESTIYNADGEINGRSEAEYDASGNCVKSTIYNADGSLYYIDEYDENGKWLKRSIYNSDGSLDCIYEYDANGKLVKATDYNADGTIRSSEFDANGNTIKSTCYNADGSINYWYEYERNEDGKIIKQTCYNADGSINYWTEYERDEDGKLVKSTDYNADGSLDCIHEYDANGNEIKSTYYNADGSYLTYEYDANGNTIKETYYNANGSLNCIYEYDENGNIIKSTYYNADGSIDYWTEYERDEDGKLIKETDYNADGSLNCIYEYDANEKLVKATDYNADGTIRSISEFDENGNIIKRTGYNADGSYHINEYDADGNRIKWTSYNADGTYHINEYDSKGNRIKSTIYNADGSYSISEYDENGNEIKWTIYNADGSISHWFEKEYDENGNEIKRTRYNADGSLYFIFEFDANEKPIKETYYNADGTVMSIAEFDENGNKIKSTRYNADGTVMSITEFDENGNTIKETYYNADGSYYINEYDVNGKLVRATDYNADGTIRSSEFDENGNTIKETYYNADSSINYWLEYEYDANGNTIKETYYNADGSLDCIYEYDANGKLVKATDYNADGTIRSSEFDENGKLIKETYYNADSSINYWYEYEYDADGNRIKGTCYNADGTVGSIFEYDASGRLIKEYVYNADGSLHYIDEYDTNGRWIKRTFYNADESINYSYESEYDANGNLLKETVYNADRNISSIIEYDENEERTRSFLYVYETDGSYHIEKYDKGGNLLEATYYESDGSYSIKKYDKDGNLLDTKYYDADGNIKKPEVINYEEYYPLFVQNGLLYHTNFASATTDDGTVSNKSAYVPFLVYRDKRIADVNPWYNGAGSTFGDGYLNFAPKNVSDNFYYNSDLKALLKAADGVTVEFTATFGANYNIWFGFGPTLKFSPSGTGVAISAPNAGSESMLASGYETIRMVDSLNSANINTYAFAMDLTDIANKSYTLDAYGNGKSYSATQTLTSTATEFAGSGSLESHTHGMNLYALRVYERELTADELLQNHFMDIAMLNGIGLAEFKALSNEDKLSVYKAFKSYAADEDYSVLIEAFDEAMEAVTPIMPETSENKTETVYLSESDNEVNRDDKNAFYRVVAYYESDKLVKKEKYSYPRNMLLNVYEYDANENLRNEIVYNADRTVDSIIQYDENEELYRSFSYFYEDDGSYSIKKYDKDGKLLYTRCYDADGSIRKPEVISYEEYYPLFVQNGLLYHTNFASATTDDGKVSGKGAYTPFLVYMDERISNPWYNGAGSTFGDGYLNFAPTSLQDYFYQGDALKALLTAADGVTVELTATFGTNFNIWLGFGPTLRFTSEGSGVILSAPDDRWGDNGMLATLGNNYENILMRDALEYAKINTFAFAIDLTNIANRNYTLDAYGNGGNYSHQNLVSGKDEFAANGELTNYRGSISIYALRVYERELTADELLQNHFMDIAMLNGFDLTELKTLDYEKQISVYRAFEFYAADEDYDLLIEVLDKAIEGEPSAKPELPENATETVYLDENENEVDKDDEKAVYRVVTYYEGGKVVKKEKFSYPQDMLLNVGWYNADGIKYITYGANGIVRSVSEFDANGNRIKETDYDAYGIISYWYEYKRDASGKIIEQIYYNADGSIDYRVVNEYDANGKLIEQTYYNADGSVDHEVVNEYGANGNRTNYTAYYDADKSLARVFDYDADGKQTATIAYKADGSIDYRFANVYGENGKLIKVSMYNADDSVNYWCESEYDVNGNLIKKSVHNDNDSLRYIDEYDTNGKCIKRTCFNDYGSIDCWYEPEYDANGRIIEVIKRNADGITDCRYEPEYDTNGRIIKVLAYNASGSLDRIFEYGTSGRCIKNTTYNGGGSVRYWHEYKYNANGSCIEDITYNADGSIRAWYEYEYDTSGNCIKATRRNADGSIRAWYEYEYDASGNCIEATRRNADGSFRALYVYDYDVNGNRIGYTLYDADGNKQGHGVYEHDSNGKLHKETVYDTDGNISYVIEYDENEELYSSLSYNYNDDGSYSIKKYDKDGNLLDTRHYGSDGNIKKPEVISYEEYYPLFVQNGLLYHTNFASATTENGKVSNNSSYVPFLVYRDERIATVNPWYNGEGSTFGDGYLAFTPTSLQDYFYRGDALKALLTAADGVTVELTATFGTDFNFWVGFGPTLKMSSSGSGIVFSAPSDRLGDNRMLASTDNNYQSFKMTESFNAANINTLAFAMDLTDIANKNYTLDVYGNGKNYSSQSLVSGKAEFAGNGELTNYTPSESYSGSVKIYALRVYERELTADELLQNHFMNIAMLNGFDLTKFKTLDDAKKRLVYEAFESYTADMEYSVLIESFNEAMKAVASASELSENETVAVYLDENGNEVDRDDENAFYRVVAYYESGKLAKKEKYSYPQGALLNAGEYENGNLITDTYYNADGSKNCSFVNEYDAKGNRIKYTFYDADGDVQYWVVCEYDASGKLIKETFHTADGVLDYINEYDAKGNRIKYTDYNAEGALDYINEYDANGKLLKKTVYNADGSISSIVEYDEDEELRWSFSYFYEADGSYSIKKYDKDGKLLYTRCYDADGSIRKPEAISYEEYYSLFVQNGLLYHTNFASATTDDGTVSNNSAYAPFLVYKDSRIGNPWYGGAGSTFGDGYLAFTPSSKQDYFYQGSVKALLTAADGVTVELTATLGTGFNFWVGFGPTLKMSSSGSGIVFSAPSDRLGDNRMLASTDNNYQSFNMTESFNAANINTLAFAMDLTDIANKNYTLDVYGNGKNYSSQSLVSGKAEFAGNGELTNYTSSESYSGSVKIYALRVYERELTADELLQNHFMDIAMLNGFDLTEFKELDDAKTTLVYKAFESYTPDAEYSVLIGVFDEAMNAAQE